jgi:hypothetical protein
MMLVLSEWSGASTPLKRLRSLLVVRLSLTVGVRRQLQQILRILEIPGATGEVTKTGGAVAQVSDSEHERFWHTAGSNLLS